MLRKVISSVLALGMLQLAFPVAAAESGFYLGLTAGASNASFEKGPLDAAVAAAYSPITVTGISKLDNSALMYGAFGGYRLNRHVAFEAGFLKLSKADYSLLGGNPMQHFSAWRSWESEGYTVSVIGTLPMGSRFDLHARGGIYFSETKFDQRMVVPIVGSATSQESLFGLGIGYRVDESLSASLDFSRYADVGTKATHESDVDAASLSVLFHF